MCSSYFIGSWWYGMVWAGSFYTAVPIVATLRDFRDGTFYVWPDRVI